MAIAVATVVMSCAVVSFFILIVYGNRLVKIYLCAFSDSLWLMLNTYKMVQCKGIKINYLAQFRLLRTTKLGGLTLESVKFLF